MGESYHLHPQMLALMREQSAAILAAKPWLAGPYAVPEPPKPVPEPVTGSELLPVVELPPGERAKAWLIEQLTPGDVPTVELQARAESAGISWSTIRQKRKAAGARVYKDGVGPWMWSIEEDE
jgi:hypothetical protein